MENELLKNREIFVKELIELELGIDDEEAKDLIYSAYLNSGYSILGIEHLVAFDLELQKALESIGIDITNNPNINEYY